MTQGHLSTPLDLRVEVMDRYLFWPQFLRRYLLHPAGKSSWHQTTAVLLLLKTTSLLTARNVRYRSERIGNVGKQLVCKPLPCSSIFIPFIHETCTCSRALQPLIWLPCDWGESKDNHIVGVCDKNEEGTSTHPQCPLGPKSALNVKSWFCWGQGSP